MRVCIAIFTDMRIHFFLHLTISIISKRFLFPNCFLGILVQREIIANALYVYCSDFSPNHVQSYKKYFNVK